MQDYTNLLKLTTDLARSRFQEILPASIREAHVCGSPACDSAKATLQKYLTFFQEAWEYAVTYSFRTEPEGIRTLLIKETQLRIEVCAQKIENETSFKIVVVCYPIFAPLLAPLFPNKGKPADLQSLYGINTHTTWQPTELYLYWVGAPAHHRAWAVVAPNMSAAVEFFGTEVGLKNETEIAVRELGKTSLLVTETIHQNHTGWASKEAIWSAGGQVTKFEFPRIVQFGQELFTEELTNAPSLIISEDKKHLN